MGATSPPRGQQFNDDVSFLYEDGGIIEGVPGESALCVARGDGSMGDESLWEEK